MTVTVYHLADDEDEWELDQIPTEQELTDQYDDGAISGPEAAEYILRWKGTVNHEYFDMFFDWDEDTAEQYLNELVEDGIAYTTEEDPDPGVDDIPL